MVTPGQRARLARAARFSPATTPVLAWAVPRRGTAVISWSVSPAKNRSGWSMCWR
jgi:hypothetical protein